MIGQVRIDDLGRAVQDFPGQHQPGGLASDLTAADAPPADVFQIADAEELARDADKPQLIADHRFDQHDLDLLQVVQGLGLFLGRQRLVLFAACKKHVPGRQLWVEVHR